MIDARAARHPAAAVRRRRRADRRQGPACTPTARESKPFAITDGIALVWAQRAGLKVGFLSARTSADDRAARRAARHHARAPGRAEQARRPTTEILDELSARPTTTSPTWATTSRPAGAGARRPGRGAGRCGGGGALARRTGSATPTGGAGAARELIEMILRAQGRWDGVVAVLRDRARSDQQA